MTNIVSDLKFVLDALRGTSPVSIDFAEITFEEGRMWARNGRVRVVAPYDGDIRGTAPCNDLLRIAKAAGEDGDIKLAAKDDRIQLSSGRFRASVPIKAEKEEAPEIDGVEWKDGVDPNLFPALAGQLKKFIDPKAARFWMSGIIFYEDRAVGTDGHKLISVNLDVPLKNVVLPLTAAEFIAKQEWQPTEVAVTDGRVAVRWESGHWYDTSTFDGSGMDAATRLFDSFDNPTEKLVRIPESVLDAVKRLEMLGAEDVVIWPDKITSRIKDSVTTEEIEEGTGAESPALWGVGVLLPILEQAEEMYWPKDREQGLWAGNGCRGLAMSKGAHQQ